MNSVKDGNNIELTKEQIELYQETKKKVSGLSLGDAAKFDAIYSLIEQIGSRGYDLLADLFMSDQTDMFLLNKEEFYKVLEKGTLEENETCYYINGRIARYLGQYPLAKACFELGKNSPNPNALYYYGLTLIEERYRNVNYKEGEACLLEASNRGSNMASFALGYAYLKGLWFAEGNIDISKAYHYLGIADTQGHEGCYFYLSSICFGKYENTPEELIDASLGLEVIEEGCRKGDPASMREVGTFYRDGLHGYNVDKKMASSFFEDAKKKGDALAAIYLGDIIKENDFTKLEEAVVHYSLGIMSNEVEVRKLAIDKMVEILNETGKPSEYRKANKIMDIDPTFLDEYEERIKAYENVKAILEKGAEAGSKKNLS